MVKSIFISESVPLLGVDGLAIVSENSREVP